VNNKLKLKHFVVDTEFTQLQGTSELISIAIVSEDGEEYYAVSKEWDEPQGRGEQTSSQFVKNIVVPALKTPRNEWKYFKEMAEEIEEFVGECTPIFWSDAADLETLFLFHIFKEARKEIPPNWPSKCSELKHLATIGLYRYPGITLVPRTFVGTKHNALDDARFNMCIWKDGLELIWKKEQGLEL
jgi:hypothetical protein